VRDYHGRDGVQQVMREWIGTWEGWSIEILRMDEAGDLVFVGALQRGRGRTSGVPMESEVVLVFTIREGAIARWQMFRSEQQAREALGPLPRD
jgi:ketosteroid isomerase-like protein